MANKFLNFEEAGELKDLTKNKSFDNTVVKARGIKNLTEDNISGELSSSRKRMDYDQIPLNIICPRYKNQYIISPETVEGLKMSIKQDGLLQPISVIEIESYLKEEKCESEEEKAYLKKKAAKGFKYFIDIGHSRYRAFVSLALDKPIRSQEELEKSYKDLNDPSKIADKKYSSISAHVTKQIGYNPSNIHSRRTTNFEIALSILDDIRKDGNEKELMEKYNATDRQGLNYVIRKVAQDRYGKDIAESGIRNYVRMESIFDPRLLQQIFDGKIALRDAQCLTSIYESIVKRGKLEELLKDIDDGTFDFKKYKKQYGTVKKNVEYSKSDLISFIYDIKNGKRTVQEVVKMLEKNSR